MRLYSSQITAKLQAEELVCFIILDMELDGTFYRYTTCNVPLVVDGHTYIPAVLRLHDTVSAGSLFSTSSRFTLSSATPELVSAFVNGTPRGSNILIRLVFVNANYYAAYASNILTNPGFETGALGDWSLTVGAGCTASASVVDSGAYQGAYCAKVTITDGWGDAEHVKDILFQQNLANAIIAGEVYDFTFAAKAAAARQIAADVGDQAGTTHPTFYNLDLTTAWKFFTLQHIARTAVEAGNAAVNFYLARSTSNDDVYIDCVRFSNSLYPLTVFNGLLDKWDLDESDLNITLVGIFYDWARTTERRHPASCRWSVFKNEECKYSGIETWCDRTYERCLTLGNTDNFGGFRWLPILMKKKIYWGLAEYQLDLLYHRGMWWPFNPIHLEGGRYVQG